MTEEQIMDVIDLAIDPEYMDKDETLYFLREIVNGITTRIDSLEQEIEEREVNES